LARMKSEMPGSGGITVGKTQRPRNTLGARDTIDIKCGKCSCRQCRGVEQVAIVDLLHGSDRFRRGVCHSAKFPLTADPYIAKAICHRRVKQCDVRLNCR